MSWEQKTSRSQDGEDSEEFICVQVLRWDTTASAWLRDTLEVPKRPPQHLEQDRRLLEETLERKSASGNMPASTISTAPALARHNAAHAAVQAKVNNVLAGTPAVASGRRRTQPSGSDVKQSGKGSTLNARAREFVLGSTAVPKKLTDPLNPDAVEFVPNLLPHTHSVDFFIAALSAANSPAYDAVGTHVNRGAEVAAAKMATAGGLVTGGIVDGDSDRRTDCVSCDGCDTTTDEASAEGVAEGAADRAGSGLAALSSWLRGLIRFGESPKPSIQAEVNVDAPSPGDAARGKETAVASSGADESSVSPAAASIPVSAWHLGWSLLAAAAILGQVFAARWRSVHMMLGK